MTRNRKIALAATLALSALAGAPTAQAGTYTVTSCIDPVTGKALGGADGWELIQSHPGEGNYVTSSSCGTDGGNITLTPVNGASGSTIGTGRTGEMRFKPPAGIRIRRYELWRAMLVEAPRPFLVSRQHSGENAEMCDAAFGTCSSGTLGSPLAAANRVSKEFDATGGGYVTLHLSCKSTCNRTATGTTVRLFSSKITLEEPDRPTFSSPPGGTLLDAGDVSGTRSLDFVAADVGSGVHRVTVTSSAKPGQPLAQKVLDSGNGRCNVPSFKHVVPCPLEIDDSLSVDTRQFPDGPQTITIQIEDAAGNTKAVERSITVHNAPASTSAPSVGGFDGQITAGTTLTCDPGTFEPAPDSIEYAWLVNGVPVAGVTGSSYVVRTEDVGESIVCRVTAVRGGGSTVVESPPVGGSGQPGGPPAPGSCAGQPTGPRDPCGDYDGDGIPNHADPDDDNDGVVDTSDPSPFDSTTVATAGGGAGGAGGAGAPGGNASVSVLLGTPTNGTNASNHARFVTSGTRTRRLRYGKRTTVTVTLRDEQGRPISGAAVAVLKRTSVPGAQFVEARSPIVSDAAGRVRWRVPAGPSRVLRFAYKANLGNTEYQSTTDLVLVVRSKTSFTSNKRSFVNGQTIRYTGRLFSRPVPRGGVLIDLQAKVGSKWQTFKTTRTKRSGRWKASYRFRATRGLQTYVFRARVRQDTGYPYAMSTSKALKVKVRG